MAKTYDMDGSVTNSIAERQQKKKKPTVVDKLKNKLKNRVLGKMLRVPDQKRLEKLVEQTDNDLDDKALAMVKKGLGI